MTARKRAEGAPMCASKRRAWCRSDRRAWPTARPLPASWKPAGLAPAVNPALADGPSRAEGRSFGRGSKVFPASDRHPLRACCDRIRMAGLLEASRLRVNPSDPASRSDVGAPVVALGRPGLGDPLGDHDLSDGYAV